MSRAVMQQALEALEKATRFMSDSDYKKLNQAIDALRAALAEPEQEPFILQNDVIAMRRPELRESRQVVLTAGTAIYTSPTPRKPQTTHWEGCEAVHPECRKPDTDCHAQGVCQRSGYSIAPTPHREPEQEPVAWYFVRDLDKGISFAPDRDPEKPWQPLYTAPTQAIEPVAWMVYTESGASAYVTDSPKDLIGAYRALPLYTAPPQRRPLTDEEIAAIASTPCAVVGSYVHTFARAIERAHGITGDSNE